MRKNSFENLYNIAVEALANNHLLECFSAMKNFDDYFVVFPCFNDDLNCLIDDYNRMLAFIKMGTVDPKRNDVYLNLCQSVNFLIEKAARQYFLDNYHNAYVAAYEERGKRKKTSINDLINDLLPLKEEMDANKYMVSETFNNLYYYKLLDLLFSYILSADLYKGNEGEQLQDFIEQLPENSQATLVTAVMLNGLQFFDAKKYALLLHFCASTFTKVRIRALAGTVLIYIRFENRFHFYPELTKGLSLTLQNKQTLEELKIMQRQLYISQQTKNAEYKIRNEIIADLNENFFKRHSNIDIEQVQENIGKMLHGEPNEEWDKIINDKKFENNMKQIIDMGKEGIDINLNTFSSIRDSSFFQKFCHWLIPFDPKRTEINSLFPNNERGKKFQEIIYASNICDSDIYSFCLMLYQIGDQQAQMVINQLTALIDKGISESWETFFNPARECRRFFQDLYRIYKTYPDIKGMYDPFEHDILFTDFPVLARELKSSAYLHEMSSFLIKYHYYNDAITYIEELLKEEPANAELLQKAAYCYQQTNLPSKAIYYYQQADLLSPNNKWVLRQMHLCYSSLKDYDKELGCLNILEQISPNNTHIAFEKGFCLMQLERYEEAAKIFYELEYKEKNVFQAWQAIAWCNFKLGRLEQADKYYNKILEDGKCSWEDYLNAGHVNWCLKKTKEAIKCYNKYMRIYGAKHKGKYAIVPFDEDRNELVAHGIPTLDIDLMHDILTPYPSALKRKP